MYHRSIRDCEKREKVEERIFDLNKHFTSSIYKCISRSLFQDHVLVFSFILCVGILRNEDKIDEDVWTFLLTGGHSDGSTTQQVQLIFPSKCLGKVGSLLFRFLLYSTVNPIQPRSGSQKKPGRKSCGPLENCVLCKHSWIISESTAKNGGNSMTRQILRSRTYPRDGRS